MRAARLAQSVEHQTFNLRVVGCRKSHIGRADYFLLFFRDGAVSHDQYGIIGPLHDRSHGTKSHMLVSKLHSGTFKTMLLVPVHLDLPLFWKSHCRTCLPAYVILYQVTGSYKGPISFQPNVSFYCHVYHHSISC